jgi:hypothetical protein
MQGPKYTISLIPDDFMLQEDGDWKLAKIVKCPEEYRDLIAEFYTLKEHKIFGLDDQIVDLYDGVYERIGAIVAHWRSSGAIEFAVFSEIEDAESFMEAILDLEQSRGKWNIK